MYRLLALVLLLSTTGCAVVSYPDKRPMQPAYQSELASADVVLTDNNLGFGKTWFRTDSSAAGASYGLIGALTTSVMDAIINSGPSKQAQKAANEIGEHVTPEHLNASFMDALQEQAASGDGGSVSLATINRRQAITTDAEDGVLSIALEYIISEEASALRVAADVSYENANVAYVTPYTFEDGKVPKEQRDGPLYKNTFIYDSDRLDLPVLSPELKTALAAQVREGYRDEEGNLPAEDSKEGRRMKTDLEAAADDELNNNEAAFFLIGHWSRNDAFFVLQEVEKAHEFVASALLDDLARTDVPSLEGEDQILMTGADGRTVRVVGKGVAAGRIVSSPGKLDAPMSIGNATSYAETYLDQVTEMRKAAKKAK